MRRFHHAATRARHALRAGFTLVEVLLVVMIMSMMFVSISQLMQAARRTRDTIHNFQEMQLAGPAVLEMITRDLRGIFTTARPRATWLEVYDRTVNGQDADRIDFVTTTDSLVMHMVGADRSIRRKMEMSFQSRRNGEWSAVRIELKQDPGVGGQEFLFSTGEVGDLIP